MRKTIGRLGRAVTRSPGAQPGGVDEVWRTVERMTAVGAVIGAVEQLSSTGRRSREEILPWPVTRTRLKRLTSGPGRRIGDAVVGPPRDHVVAAVKLAAGLRLLLGRPGHTERGILLASLATANVVNHLRVGGYGMDGSDHLSTVTFAAAALDKLPGNTPSDRRAVLSFLAAQSVLAYATSGLVKLTSPTWRGGDAIPGVLRTRTYGDRGLFSVVRSQPVLAKGMAWSVILTETLFPVVLVLPPRWARASLAAGAAFHLANGRYMGLNRFFWAFTATYPAVDFLRAELAGAARTGTLTPSAAPAALSAALSAASNALTTASTALTTGPNAGASR